MAGRSGAYLRANIDIPFGGTPDEQMVLVGGETNGLGLTFVDVCTRTPVPTTSTRGIVEKLTNAVQDRLHLISTHDRLLFRWPWLAGPGNPSQVAMIDDWLDRLVEVMQPRSEAGGDGCLGVIQHQVSGAPSLHWSGEEPRDTDTFLSHARAIEMRALLDQGNAIWQPKTYHYRLPSGYHTDVFIRLADAIQSPRDAYVIACWLSDRLSDGIGIVVDTGGFTPVLIQIENFMAQFDLLIGPMAILQSYPAGRPAVRRTVEEAASGLATGILGLQSVSSSGDLLGILTDELERVAESRGLDYSLDVLVDRHKGDEACARLSPSDAERAISWLGLGKEPEVKASGSCEFCRDPEKAHYVAVNPRTYGEMALPAPHLVMPDIHYADDGHLLWEHVAQARALAIEANPHPSSRVARGKRTALPVRLMFELIVGSEGLTELVKNRLREVDLEEEVLDRLSHTALVVVTAQDLGDRERPAFAEGGLVNFEAGLRSVIAGLGLDGSMPIVAHGDPSLAERVGELGAGDNILIFSWGAVTGLTLRQLKLSVADALRECQRELDVNGLVFHSRPSTPGEWTALQNQFRPGVLIDLWTSCYPWESPLADERRLLDRSGLQPFDLTEPERKFLDLRTRFLRLHEDHMGTDDDWSPRFVDDDGTPDPRHVFWGMSPDGNYQEQVRGRSLYGEGLDCLTAYAAIGAVIHYTRLNEQPEAAPRWVMFDLGRLVRSYFDAVIICSVLRWLRPGELWWGGVSDDTDSVRDSVSFLLDQVIYDSEDRNSDQDGIEEQVLLVPELLLACAQGKIPATAHDLVCDKAVEIMDGWPNDESFELARGAVRLGLTLLEPAEQ